MTDRRFAEQGDDLKDRARWDAEAAPEGATDSAADGAQEDDAESLRLDRDQNLDQNNQAQNLAEGQDENLDGTDEPNRTAFPTSDPASASNAGLTSNTDPASDVDLDSAAASDEDEDDLRAPAVVRASHPLIPAQTSASTSTPGAVSAPSAATADRDRAAAAGAGSQATEQLLPRDESETLRAQWQSIQAGFVDDPRHSVEEADGLLEQVAERFAQSLAAARSNLREGWDGNGPGSAADDSGTSTEHLRGTLQDYRRMVDRLLNV